MYGFQTYAATFAAERRRRLPAYITALILQALLALIIVVAAVILGHYLGPDQTPASKLTHAQLLVGVSLILVVPIIAIFLAFEAVFAYTRVSPAEGLPRVFSVLVALGSTLLMLAVGNTYNAPNFFGMYENTVFYTFTALLLAAAVLTYIRMAYRWAYP